MLREHMTYEHAITYLLCLSKCKSVNSINQAIQYLQDEDNKIKTFKTMEALKIYLPEEVSREKYYLNKGLIISTLLFSAHS